MWQGEGLGKGLGEGEGLGEGFSRVVLILSLNSSIFIFMSIPGH